MFREQELQKFPNWAKANSPFFYRMPWDAPGYLEIYKQVAVLIERVDLAVVVLDVLFAPGIDASRALKRREVIISPNSVKDTFVDQQPRLSMFWKYPLWVLPVAR